LSFFSDAIFAVLIAVLVLELRPPTRPSFGALLQQWPTWLTYATGIALRYLYVGLERCCCSLVGYLRPDAPAVS